MGRERIDEWYLYDYCRKAIHNIDFIRQTYNSKIVKIYSSPETEAKRLQEQLSKVPTTDIKDESDIELAAFIRYEAIRTIQYQMLATFVCLIYQAFEQFMITITIHQMELRNDNYAKEKIKTIKDNGSMKMVLEVLDLYGCHLKGEDGAIFANNTLEELRLLVNVIKHGQGKSKKILKKTTPSLFKPMSQLYDIDDMYDTVEAKCFSILEPELNLSNNLLNCYTDEIISWLQAIPSKMESVLRYT